MDEDPTIEKLVELVWLAQQASSLAKSTFELPFHSIEYYEWKAHYVRRAYAMAQALKMPGYYRAWCGLDDVGDTVIYFEFPLDKQVSFHSPEWIPEDSGIQGEWDRASSFDTIEGIFGEIGRPITERSVGEWFLPYNQYTQWGIGWEDGFMSVMSGYMHTRFIRGHQYLEEEGEVEEYQMLYYIPRW